MIQGAKSWPGSSTDVWDTDGHGTHTTTLFRKAAPNAKIFVAKVFETVGTGDQDMRNVSDV